MHRYKCDSVQSSSAHDGDGTSGEKDACGNTDKGGACGDSDMGGACGVDEGEPLSPVSQCASYDRLNPYSNLGDVEPVNLISFAYQIASGMVC